MAVVTAKEMPSICDCVWGDILTHLIVLPHLRLVVFCFPKHKHNRPISFYNLLAIVMESLNITPPVHSRIVVLEFSSAFWSAMEPLIV